MLTEEQIEKYIYDIVKGQDEFFLFVVLTTAKRLEANSHIKSLNTMHSLEETFKATQDVNRINAELKKLKASQLTKLKKSLQLIAHRVFSESAGLFNDGTSVITQKPRINGEVTKIINDALYSFASLVDNPVIVLDNKVHTPEQAYRRTVQLALQTRQLLGPMTSLRNATEPLFNARLKYLTNDKDENGKRIVADTRAVRMNVLNSIKSVIQTVTDLITRHTKPDGVELSAHAFPAPDHAPAQGHQFSNEEFDKMQSGLDFTDVTGRQYTGFERQIGQWNCRHYVKPIKIGKTKPEYTQEELDNILANNERGYTTKDGRHYTLYECTQVQRGYERKIKEAREHYKLSKALGDTVNEKKYLAQSRQYLQEYKLFSKSCGIAFKLGRTGTKDT